MTVFSYVKGCCKEEKSWGGLFFLCVFQAHKASCEQENKRCCEGKGTMSTPQLGNKHGVMLQDSLGGLGGSRPD